MSAIGVPVLVAILVAAMSLAGSINTADGVTLTIGYPPGAAPRE